MMSTAGVSGRLAPKNCEIHSTVVYAEGSERSRKTFEDAAVSRSYSGSSTTLLTVLAAHVVPNDSQKTCVELGDIINPVGLTAIAPGAFLALWCHVNGPQRESTELTLESSVQVHINS